MKLDRIIAISGRSGLFRMASNSNTGLIVEDLDNGKRSFVSGRLHQFTPLESISIYTTTEEATVELKTVFANMLAQEAENPPVAQNADPAAIRTYFIAVLPEHDRDKVLISDIKKILKWYGFLKERNMLTAE